MSPRRPRKASQLATALIEHSSDAIALVDEAGTVLYANPAAAQMLGLPIAEIINSNVFRWVHDDDMLMFSAQFRKRLDQPGVPVKNAFRLRYKDGTWRHIESVGVNRLDDPGIRGIIINYRDINRKSTRLNSSHGYISYAVFCLKKKKTTKTHSTTSAPAPDPPLPSRPIR